MKLARFLSHLFIPQESNNQKAQLLHSSLLFLVAAVILLSQMGVRRVPFPYPSILGYAANISVEEVIRLTNERRLQADLPPLEENPNLSKAALAKGTDMLGEDYWAHISPDGTEPWYFFRNVGYRYRYAGENLARDFSDANSAVSAWMASPSHRDNLLSPKYKEIGIGVVEGDLAGVDTTIIVQFFGTKLTDTAPISPVASSETIPPAPAAIPEVKKAALVSPFNVNRTGSMVLVGVFITAVAVDMFVIEKRKITRVAGRPFAHFAFLGMVLALIIIAKAGRIL